MQEPKPPSSTWCLRLEFPFCPVAHVFLADQAILIISPFLRTPPSYNFPPLPPDPSTTPPGACRPTSPCPVATFTRPRPAPATNASGRRSPTCAFQSPRRCRAASTRTPAPRPAAAPRRGASGTAAPKLVHANMHRPAAPSPPIKWW